MHNVRVLAPAKVNVALRVGAPRPDGFHPLDTVFESLDLFDEILAEAHSEGIVVSMEGQGAEDLPVDESNLVVRAARALIERTGYTGGARIRVRKRIPIAGGMAGGSTDAAGTLVALNDLWELGLSRHDLFAVAADLGSDVPFCLLGGLARGRGRGEQLESLRPGAMHSWVFLTSSEGLSTPAVFREFDRLHDAGATGSTEHAVPAEPASTDPLCLALAGADLDSVAEHMINDLQGAAFSLRPDLARIVDELVGFGVVILSGSGPTIAVLNDDATTADALAGRLKRLYPDLGIVRADGPSAGAHVVEAR